MNPSIAYMRDACPLLGVDGQGETDATIQVLFWKAMYEHMVAHVDQLHAAFERLVTGDDDALEGCDLALFLDPFLTSQPVDLIAHLQAGRSTAFQTRSTVLGD